MVQRPDGTSQLTLGGWPVYRFAGDTEPGATGGQGSSGTWFAVTPEGKKAAGTGSGAGGRRRADRAAPRAARVRAARPVARPEAARPVPRAELGGDSGSDAGGAGERLLTATGLRLPDPADHPNTVRPARLPRRAGQDGPPRRDDLRRPEPRGFRPVRSGWGWRGPASTRQHVRNAMSARHRPRRAGGPSRRGERSSAHRTATASSPSRGKRSSTWFRRPSAATSSSPRAAARPTWRSGCPGWGCPPGCWPGSPRTRSVGGCATTSATTGCSSTTSSPRPSRPRWPWSWSARTAGRPTTSGWPAPPTGSGRRPSWSTRSTPARAGRWSRCTPARSR